MVKKFVTHNDVDIAFQSSHLIGYIVVSYSKLVEKFGNPQEVDMYKVDAGWTVLFENGDYATIYNYKDGINYNGEDGCPTKDITNWHIGGSGDNDKIVRIITNIQQILTS